MKETERIRKLFEDLYAGNPWIEVNIVDSLVSLGHEKAAVKFQGRNSIWEIVNHMISWRENVLQRLEGEQAPAPDHNYFVPVTDNSSEAWKSTLQHFHDSQSNWISKLVHFNDEAFQILYKGNKLTYYEHILGILQHDAYHLGQIVLLSKILDQP